MLFSNFFTNGANNALPSDHRTNSKRKRDNQQYPARRIIGYLSQAFHICFQNFFIGSGNDDIVVFNQIFYAFIHNHYIATYGKAV